MSGTKVISRDTRVIDLTLGELLDVLTTRLTETLTERRESREHPEALLDTWQVASLLAVTPKHDPGPEPPEGTPEWRTWRVKRQSVRDDVAHHAQLPTTPIAPSRTGETRSLRWSPKVLCAWRCRPLLGRTR